MYNVTTTSALAILVLGLALVGSSIDVEHHGDILIETRAKEITLVCKCTRERRGCFNCCPV